MIEIALIFQMVLWMFLCKRFLRSKEASLFHPLAWYLIVHGIVFVARPLMVYFLHFNQMWQYMRFIPTEKEFIQTLSVSSFALIIFFFVVLYTGRCKPKFQNNKKINNLSRQRLAFWITLVILGPIALYSAVISIAGPDFLGMGSVQMAIVDAIAIYQNTTGYIVHAKDMFGTLIVLLIVLYRYRWWTFTMLLAYVCYRSFLGWDRWTIVFAIITILLVWLWEKKRKFPSLKILIMIPILLLLFVTLGDNRYILRNYLAGKNIKQSIIDNRSWEEKLDTADFANFDYLAYVVSTVPGLTKTYSYGVQYLQLFTEPIPRILWKNKPVGPPIQYFNLNDYGNFANRTVSLPGDGWMSGGWIGVFLTMAIVGIILGRFHRWFWKGQSDIYRVLFYVVALPAVILHYRDGGIYIFKFLLFTTFPLFVWLAVIKILKIVVGRASEFETNAHVI